MAIIVVNSVVICFCDLYIIVFSSGTPEQGHNVQGEMHSVSLLLNSLCNL